MSLIAKQSESNYEITPEGNHVAICYMVCDLGLQETEWQGQKKKQHKVRIAYELCNEPMEDGRPFSVSKNYTMSLSEKAALRKDLEAWRGRKFTEQELKGFDLFTVLGHPCMVSVVHNESNGKTYANINAVTAIPKGLQVPEMQNGIIRFSLSEYTPEAFSMLPEWLQGMINTDGIENPYAGPQSENPGDGLEDDDIPF